MEQQIFALQRENAELHQTLEIVMSKYYLFYWNSAFILL